jgi:hypothetical protein
MGGWTPYSNLNMASSRRPGDTGPTLTVTQWQGVLPALPGGGTGRGYSSVVCGR